MISSDNEQIDINRISEKILKEIGGKNSMGVPVYNFPEKNNPIEYCGSNNTCGDRMYAVWRKSSNPDDINALIRRGYTTDNFNKAWNDLLKLGYHCYDIETYLENGTRKWDGLFKKGAAGSYMWREYSEEGFNAKWKEMNAAGFRLIDIETYVDGGQRKWAGLFIKSSEPSYALWRGFNTADFGTKNIEMQNKNFKLIDIEAYTDNGVIKWAGVWLGRGQYLLNRNYDQAPFLQLNTGAQKNGWRLMDIEAYQIGSNTKFAGVWEKSVAADSVRLSNPCCQFIGRNINLRSSDYELLDMGTYISNQK
jgi:hypothetical protein